MDNPWTTQGLTVLVIADERNNEQIYPRARFCDLVSDTVRPQPVTVPDITNGVLT